jgi:hypothetical protein
MLRESSKQKWPSAICEKVGGPFAGVTDKKSRKQPMQSRMGPGLQHACCAAPRAHGKKNRPSSPPQTDLIRLQRAASRRFRPQCEHQPDRDACIQLGNGYRFAWAISIFLQLAAAMACCFPWRLSAAKSSSESLMLAAATFSSRCFTFDVPGIGSITGLRLRTHASAI